MKISTRKRHLSWQSAKTWWEHEWHKQVYLKYSFKINVVNLYYHFTLPGRGLTKHWLAATASLCSLIASAQPTLPLHWHWSGVTWSKLILFKFLINIFKCNAMQCKCQDYWANENSLWYILISSISTYIYITISVAAALLVCSMAWPGNKISEEVKREQLPAVCPALYIQPTDHIVRFS